MNCQSISHNFNSIFMLYQPSHPTYQKAEKLEKMGIVPTIQEYGVGTKSYHASLQDKEGCDVFVLSEDGEIAKKPIGIGQDLSTAIARVVHNLRYNTKLCTVKKIEEP